MAHGLIRAAIVAAAASTAAALLLFSPTRSADEILTFVRRTSLSVTLFDGLGSPSYGRFSSTARLATRAAAGDEPSRSQPPAQESRQETSQLGNASPDNSLPAAATRAALAPASERFAAAGGDETPDFQRHVVPLLGRLGCNGRACHGSFQGQGGFRLSLFGYDFQMDHAALTARASSGDDWRVDRGKPAASLVLRKPTMEVDHDGGELIEAGSWEHNLLTRWIVDGARASTQSRELLRLEIEPSEIVFARDSSISSDVVEPVPLRVLAVWRNDDGEEALREDVTPLCRFRTNDDAVATIDANGHVHSEGPGDTHVIAFYDNGIAAVPVMRPVADARIATNPAVRARTTIDELIETKLGKLGIVPSPVCSDSEFLRRASIDIAGTLPTPNEVEAFLADRSPDKRLRKIDELLDRPAYAAWWTNKLCDFTGCNPNQQSELGQETSVQWYSWILRRVEENMPYDKLIERIVLATGRIGDESFDEYCARVSSYYRESDAGDFADRETMPHYWSRRSLDKSDEKALAFAHSFLGLQLQCAQCHKHPFAPWTQDDFKQFASFFDSVRFGVRSGDMPRYREMAGQVGQEVRGENGSPVRPETLRHAEAGRSIPWREVFVAERNDPSRLNLLRSGEVFLAPDEDPRRAIMQWTQRPENPWFARAFVNRVWAGYFHVGIVEPPDDLNPANPPSNPELLDWLTEDVIASGYDMKRLHRTIVASDAYQRSWRPNETNRDDRRNFSRAIPRRLPAEVVYDSVKQATAAADQLDEVRRDLTRRAIGHLSMRLAGTYAMHVFGKPDRAVNCDCERVNQPTLLQAVFLQNDPLIEQRLDESGWIAEIASQEETLAAADGEVRNTRTSDASLDRAALIRAAWLRTVGRPPSSGEAARAEKHLAAAPTTADGMRDLLWALINTKEFMLNH